MKILLAKLTLENFKGIRSFTLEPGNKCLVKGDNATYKTTLMDGFLWLLFGKDSQGKSDFAIKTLKDGKEIPNIEHSVEAELKIEGQVLTLQKVLKECYSKKRGSSHAEFTGHKVDHYIDGVPIQKKDWDQRISGIISEEAFKLLTSPTYFNSLHWERRRSLLLEVCGDISDSDVIASDKALAALPEILGNKSLADQKKIIAAKRTEINNRLKEIPSRIDELNKSLADVSGYDIAAIQVSIRGLDRQIQAMKDDTQLSNLRKRKAGVEAELSEIEVEKGRVEREATKDTDILVKKLEGELREKIAYVEDCLAEITRTRNVIKHNEIEMGRLRVDYAEIAAQKPEVENTCPTCGQALPKAEIDAAIKKHNQRQASRLADINSEGKRFTNVNAQLKESIENLTQKSEKCAKEAAPLEEELSKLKSRPVDEIPFDTSKIDKLNIQIEAIEKEIAANPPKDTEPLEDKRRALQAQVAEVTAARKTNMRIVELIAEERTLAADYEELERQDALMDKFTVAKVELLEGKINSKFSLARFKLFEKQINEGIRETCVTLFDGVPYGYGLNTGMEINVGLDIVKTLSEHYGIKAPIFIDHAESVTDILDPCTQTIKLIVNKDYPKMEVTNHE